MRLAVRHLARVLAGVLGHAVHRRRIGVLALICLGGTVVVLTVVGHIVAPYALYPFL